MPDPILVQSAYITEPTTGTQWPGLGVNADAGASGPTAEHEPGTEIKWRTAGTFARLYARMLTNGHNRSSTLKWIYGAYPGSAVGNQSIPWDASIPGVQQDLSNTDAVAAGTICHYQWTPAGGGSGTATWGPILMQFTPTSTYAYNWTSGEKASQGTATRYWDIWGRMESSTIETANDMELRMAGTWANEHVGLFTNAWTGDSTITARKNASGVGMNQTITFTGGSPGQTGHKYDESNTDAIVSGDAINWLYTRAAGSGTGPEVAPLGCSFTPSTDVCEIGCSGVQSIAAGVTEYLPVSGSASISSTTRSDTQSPAQFAMTASLLRGYWRTYSLTGDSTVALELDAIVGNLTKAMGATGWHITTSETDAIALGAQMNYSVVPPGAGSASEIRKVLILTEDATVAASAAEFRGAPMGPRPWPRAS